MNFFITQAGADPKVVAASLLGIRSSRGLYLDPSGYGNSLRSRADLLSETAVRLSIRGLLRRAIAVMSFGVWAHHMFSVGMGPIADAFFSIATMLIAIPTGVKILNWIGTIWSGAIRPTTPFLFAVGFIAMFIIAASVASCTPPAGRSSADRHLLHSGAFPLRPLRWLDIWPGRLLPTTGSRR